MKQKVEINVEQQIIPTDKEIEDKEKTYALYSRIVEGRKEQKIDCFIEGYNQCLKDLKLK